jgi:hypothetical protein
VLVLDAIWLYGVEPSIAFWCHVLLQFSEYQDFRQRTKYIITFSEVSPLIPQVQASAVTITQVITIAMEIIRVLGGVPLASSLQQQLTNSNQPLYITEYRMPRTIAKV